MREGERAGEKHRCVRDTSTGWWPLTLPQPGTWPATLACALTANGTSDLLVLGPALSPLSHTGQGRIFFLNPSSCTKERSWESRIEISVL